MDSQKLHEVVCDAVRDIRQQLAFMEEYSNFSIEIKASGRVHEGEVKISYEVGDNSYKSEVKGNDLNNVLEEFMRRKGWDERNAPLALPSPRPTPVLDNLVTDDAAARLDAEEIPF